MTNKRRNPSELQISPYKTTFLYVIVLLLMFFPLIQCASNSDSPSTHSTIDKPNIIYILADDLGYGDLGVYGQTQIKTPNLDKLAANGMLFTQHYAGSTVCAPSRSVLMTGQHGGRTPVRGNAPVFPIGQMPLPSDIITLPKMLSRAGYATGAFGKWGLGAPESKGMPTRQGFDHFFGYLCQRRAHFYYPEFLFEDIKGEPLQEVILPGNKVIDNPEKTPGAGPAVQAVTYAPDVIQQKLIQFLETHKDGPFFIYNPTLIPHASLEVPSQAMSIYLDDQGNSLFDEPETVRTGNYTDQPKPKAAYAAMVTYLDKQVGEIIQKLDELGIADNTLVIFTSDNGSYSEGGYHYSYLNSNAPFRGGKRDLYEGGIRVPMIAAWPGHIKPGTKSDHVSIFQDMLPTFADLAGASTPEGLDGISMVAELRGENHQAKHEFLYWEFHELGGRQAIRKGDWKAIRLGAKTGNVVTELYDLSVDAAEQTNLAAQYPEILNELLDLMDESHEPSGDCSAVNNWCFK